jgi:hypothetical protein
LTQSGRITKIEAGKVTAMLDFDDVVRFATAFLVPALFALVVLYIWLTTREDRRKKDAERSSEKNAANTGRPAQ